MLSLIRNIGRKCIKTFEVLTGKALIIVLKSPQLKQNFFTNLLYIGIFIYMYICILYIYIYIYIYLYIIYIYIYIHIFFEAAIESWPEWDLNPRLQNSVQML